MRTVAALDASSLKFWVRGGLVCHILVLFSFQGTAASAGDVSFAISSYVSVWVQSSSCPLSVAIISSLRWSCYHMVSYDTIWYRMMLCEVIRHDINLWYHVISFCDRPMIWYHLWSWGMSMLVPSQSQASPAMRCLQHSTSLCIELRVG